MFRPNFQLLLCLPLTLLFLPSLSLISNSSSVHLDESLSLLEFKKSLHTTGLEDWESGSDCCEWYGITCDPTTQHVIELSLIDVGLIGKLGPNSTLSNLRHLQTLVLSLSGLTGKVPDEIFQLPRLQYLDLSQNDGLFFNLPLYNWSTSLEYLHLSSVNLSSNLPSYIPSNHLQVLDLSNCSLYGPIPTWVWNISVGITLSHNYLTGKFPSQVNNMNVNWIDLGFNKLSGNISIDILAKLPNLDNLVLSSSGLSVSIAHRYVNFTGNWPQLSILHLSNTSIHGEFPNWMQQMWNGTLMDLDLSQNYLTGSLSSLPWMQLSTLDISFNMLRGQVPPIPLYFYARNNNFTGSIESLVSRWEAPIYLDLYNNSLSGDLQQFQLFTSDMLRVLNLGSNNITGTLPANISTRLSYLDLSGNGLQGSIPLSLVQCTTLQLINLRCNNFTDIFPYWLISLPQIQVLDLAYNSFHGEIELISSKPNHQYPNLRILDLSNNKFSGNVSPLWIRNFNAMMNADTGSPNYMEFRNLFKFSTISIVLNFNGLILKYEKIINSLTIFDLSNNAFEGDIPHSIGELAALHGLNLSHNQFRGHIPSSLSNLTLVNSLDLSHNLLTGRIPQGLVSLTSLGVFNVSENQLVGPIPHGNNFDTFDVGSYEGNRALCGFPLPECGKHGGLNPGTPTRGSEDDDSSSGEDEGIFMLAEWKIVMLGYVSGTVVGLAWGYYMLSIGRPLWLIKCLDKYVS